MLIKNGLTLRRAIVINWALIFFTLPFPFVALNAQLIILLLILSFAYYRKRDQITKSSKYPYIYLFIPMIACLTSWLFMSDHSFKILEKEAPTLFFPLVSYFLYCSDFKLSRKDYLALLIAFLASVILVILYTSVRYFFLPEDFLNHEFLTFSIIHPTYFSFYCGVAIFIIIERVRIGKTSSSQRRWIAYLGMALILLYMTTLSSRMPLFATIILVIVLLIFSVPGLKKKIFITIGIGLLLSIAAYAISFSPRLEYRFYLAFEKNFATRINEWKASWQIYCQHPFYGIGIGSEQAELDSFYRANFENAEEYIGLNSHNYFLHILLIYGSFGFLFILFFWIKIFLYAFVSQNRLLIFVLILFLLCSMTEVMLARQKGIVFLFLFFSVHLLFEDKAIFSYHNSKNNSK